MPPLNSSEHALLLKPGNQYDAMDFNFDDEDDISSALGTETLAARDMVPEGFDNPARACTPTEQLIQGRRYLRVS
jgi:hypothetical protein